MTSYEVPDGPKMLRETLCLAQTAIGAVAGVTGQHHIALLQRLVDECDRHRPLGRDGTHGDRHTRTCGCEDKQGARLVRVFTFRRWSGREESVTASSVEIAASGALVFRDGDRIVLAVSSPRDWHDLREQPEEQGHGEA
ncbi:hypothetical protein [Mangrovihabitans endophyticus]|uniref:hypothetical protein n=1 Tax=Mangrovihabitans endophyticus TaxID=1751298 RepID=UPI001669AC93|nr:hypothetical protein [Mangrovihabitans endophyticus]